MDKEDVAQPPRARGGELLFQWFSISILMVVVGFGVQFWSYGGPTATLPYAEWFGRATGMTLGFAMIPMYVAAWTHMKRPWLVLLTWAPIALLSSFGAVVLHEQNAQLQITATTTSSATAPLSQYGPQEKATPPPGFSYEKVAPADPVAESARWDRDAIAFESIHPAVKYGENAKIVQEKLEGLVGLGLHNGEMLDRAYAAAVLDSRWRTIP